MPKAAFRELDVSKNSSSPVARLSETFPSAGQANFLLWPAGRVSHKGDYDESGFLFSSTWTDSATRISDQPLD